ncbi:peptidylprolyl isomerase [Methyloraptor flagellatus]|jgi:peptidyl-prolyl cis-trans isomerase C|uniref:Parvulin-like PPIase n=1 Tax=Methyloraptor flagellatus TaxID=3162530 RepID=A0AAU7XGK6_9HYPH
MKKAFLGAGVAALVISAVLAGPALADPTVLARVDGQPVTDQDVAQLMATMGQQLAQLPEPARKRAVLDRLIDMKVVANQAAKDGLDKSEDVQKKLEQVKQQLLINEFVKQKVDAPITEAMLKARYDKDAAAYNPPDETRARHILVKTKEEAVAIIADLGKGGDFAKIATEKSQDPGSAKQGGDLGYFGAGDMVKPFEDALTGLKPGEYTKTPVETQFGFHVIKLEDRRKPKVPGFDEVKDQVRQAVVGDRFSEMLGEMKKGAKIEVDEAALAK